MRVLSFGEWILVGTDSLESGEKSVILEAGLEMRRKFALASLPVAR